MFTSRISTSTLVAGGLLAAGVAAAGALTATGALAAGGAPSDSSPAGGAPSDSSPAASPTPAPTPSGGTDRAPLARGRHGGGPMGGLGRDHAGVLHGEYVVNKPGGGTMTVVVQTGTIATKSGNDVTVKSTDGYTLTWTLNSSTTVRTGWSTGAVKDLAVGDAVRAQGTKSGSGATARAVLERPSGTSTTAPGSQPRRGGPGWPGRNGSTVPRPAPPRPAPSPMSSGSASSGPASSGAV